MPMTFGDLPEPNEVTWASGRLTTRTYVSRSFDMTFGQDAGQKARYIHKVFDEVHADDRDEWEWEKHVVYTTPGGRKQLELNVARSAGSVRKIRRATRPEALPALENHRPVTRIRGQR